MECQYAAERKGLLLYDFIIRLICCDFGAKSVRDRAEGIAVTDLYYGISWFATIAAMVLLTIGLWNADLLRSEKGFYAMAFCLSMFSAIAVQKNTRDAKMFEDKEL